jgi:ribosomal protein S12 methylthiotransferase accessory factor YcaO
MLEHFLAAGSTIDVIMPGRGGETHFSRLLQEMSAKGAAPTLYHAPSAEELPVCMAKAINARTGGQTVFETAAREAVQGIDKPAKAMSVLKIRKPVVE